MTAFAGRGRGHEAKNEHKEEKRGEEAGQAGLQETKSERKRDAGSRTRTAGEAEKQKTCILLCILVHSCTLVPTPPPPSCVVTEGKGEVEADTG